MLTVQVRSLNYVCGNDPMLYIRAARTFLSPGFYGPEALKEAATFVAPGYPLILAVCIKIFGSLSPYWLNLFFVLFTIPLMYGVLKTLMRSERAACFSVLGMLWILIQGHALHAPYLLYPFREASRIFFVTFCFWSFLKAISGSRTKKIWTLVSSFSFMAACGIREPTFFLMPGFLAGSFFLFPKEHPRFKTLGVFLIPWAVLGLIVGGLILLGYLDNFSQFSVSRYLRNHGTALQRIRQMLPWFLERGGGWMGCILVIAGCLRSWIKSRTLLLWYALPALLLFVFYAYVHMHVRYFMTTLILLLPFAGYGLDGLLQGLEQKFPRKHMAIWTAGMVLSVGVYGMVRTAEDVEPWGPETSILQVREWQERIGKLEKGADGKIHIALEQRCRYLEDMILSYSDAQLLDPKRIEDWSGDVYPATYFYPRNRAAFYATPQWLDYKEVYAHRQIEHVLNLFPAGEEKLYIGKGEYEQFTITPWDSGIQEQQLDLPPGEDSILMLNWGDCDPNAVRNLELYQGRNLLMKLQGKGKGIQSIFFPAELAQERAITLKISSDAPVPGHPVFSVMGTRDRFYLETGTDRMLSSNFLITNRKDHDLRPVYPLLRTDRPIRFKAPKLLQYPVGWHWVVSPQLEKFPPEADWQLSGTISGQDHGLSFPLDKNHPFPGFKIFGDQEISLLLISPEPASASRRLNLRAMELQLGNPPLSR